MIENLHERNGLFHTLPFPNPSTLLSSTLIYYVFPLFQVGRAQVNALAEKERQCQKHLKDGQYSTSVCFHLLDDVVGQSQGGDSRYKVSTYDARRTEPKGAPRTFPPGHKVVETYLGGWTLDEGGMDSGVYTDVLKAIHASAATEAGQRYKECTDPPYNALSHQDGLGVTQDVVDILEHEDNIRLLFFNGMEDLICNHVGNEKLLENLPWKGREDWVKGARYAWMSQYEEEGKVSGYMKEYENLMFLKLLGSGHMVPLDIPDKSLDMMRIFVTNGSFETNLQNLPSAASAPSSTRDSKKECPVCPTCEECEVCPPPPENDSSTSTSSIPSSSQAGDSSSSSGGALAGVIVIAVVLGLAAAIFVIRGRGRRLAMTGRTAVAQSDLELREGSYTDAPGRSNRNGFA